MESTTISQNTSTPHSGTTNQWMTSAPLNASTSSTNSQYPLSMLISQSTVGSVIVVLNVVTGMGLVRCRGTNKFLMMLLTFQALSDIFVGIIYIYLSIFTYAGLFSIAECIVRYCLLRVTSEWSLVTVTMISVERILAIRFPFKHQDTESSRLFMTLIGLCCWLGPIIFVFIESQFINTDIQECNMLTLVQTTFFALNGILGVALNVLIIVCNIYLFKTSIDHIRRIVPTFVGPDKRKQAIKLNLKATLTSASVIIPFIILNLPMYVMYIVIIMNPSLRVGMASRYISFTVYSLVVINSAVNPIMYTWRMEELRSQIKRQFGIRTGQVRNIH